MKLTTTKIQLLLMAAGLLAGTSSLSAYQPGKQKKMPNIALNITNKKSIPARTYFSLGILGKTGSLNGIGVNVISNTANQDLNGLGIGGFTNINGRNANGIQLAGIANIIGNEAKGLTVGGLMNITGKTSKGIQLSTLGNIGGESLHGVSLTGLINLSSNNMSGFQFAGLANICGDTQYGLSVGGLMNVTANTLKGVQISSLLNISGNEQKGLQLAALGNVCVINKGVQLGLCNYGDNNKGIQTGVANVNNNGRKGLQLGIVNISRDSASHQIGCINLKPTTRIQLVVSGGNANKFNVAVRFKNRHTYTQLGTGAYYLGIDKDFSISGFYRAGMYYPILPKLEISADLGYYHIETLKNKNCPKRLYAIQPRINLEYNITQRLGIFASGGYGWTRTYQGNHDYNHKGIFEVGIVLF